MPPTKTTPTAVRLSRRGLARGAGTLALGAAIGLLAQRPAALAKEGPLWVAQPGVKGDLIGFSLATGQRLWTIPAGVLAADGSAFYRMAVDGGNTWLDEHDPQTGQLRRRFGLDGIWDGTATWQAAGVSPNGRWVAVGRIPTDQERRTWGAGSTWHSDIRIVDTRLGEIAETISLDGNYEVETIAAGGQALFLIQHLPASNPDHYQIRLYNLTQNQLDPNVIRSKTTDEVMAGYAWDGVASRNGQWLLTLYLSTKRDVAFVHTLDLVNAFAVCVDLPSGSGAMDLLKAYTLRLSPEEQRLFAANPALSVVAEISLESRSVVRTTTFKPQAAAAAGGATGPTSHSAISRDGALLAFGGGTAVWLYDTAEASVRGPLPVGDSVQAVGLSADARTVLVAGTSGRLHALDATSGQALGFPLAVAGR